MRVCVCDIPDQKRDIYGGPPPPPLLLLGVRFGCPLFRGGYIIINNTTAHHGADNPYPRRLFVSSVGVEDLYVRGAALGHPILICGISYFVSRLPGRAFRATFITDSRSYHIIVSYRLRVWRWCLLLSASRRAVSFSRRCLSSSTSIFWSLFEHRICDLVSVCEEVES